MPRHPNLIWAQLADPGLMATFIADGHHLPADTFTAMLRAKGLECSILVSDGVALAGMAPGVYDQDIGGQVEVSKEGRIGIAGGPFLAGAGRPLVANLATAMEMAELTLHEALGLATVNPCRLIRRDRSGLAVGCRGDMLRFRFSPGTGGAGGVFEILNVIVGGEKIS